MPIDPTRSTPAPSSLHRGAALITRLPLCEQRPVVELEPRWMLSDGEVDRSAREGGGKGEREQGREHGSMTQQVHAGGQSTGRSIMSFQEYWQRSGMSRSLQFISSAAITRASRYASAIASSTNGLSPGFLRSTLRTWLRCTTMLLRQLRDRRCV